MHDNVYKGTVGTLKYDNAKSANDELQKAAEPCSGLFPSRAQLRHVELSSNKHV